MHYTHNRHERLNQQTTGNTTKQTTGGQLLTMGRRIFHNPAGQAIFALLILFAFLLAPLHASADSVTLAWDPNAETPDQYKVFQRTGSGSYDFNAPVCPKQGDDPTSNTCTVDNLAPDTLFYFVVRAYVGSDHSENSNEISYRTKAAPPVTYTISASAGSHGAVSPSGNITVTSGSSRTFTFLPNSGYHVKNTMVNGQSMGALGSYTFSNITRNHTLSVSFAPDTYNISASAGSGGTISPGGNISVSHGSNKLFSFVPQSGYHVSNVTVDGQTAGAPSSYTFTDITRGHTIAVSFSADAYTINASAGSGGSISPSGSVGVSHASSKRFSFVPQNGYHVSNVTVDGQSVGAPSSYTFTNITRGHAIAVSFAINNYTINASAGSGGSILPSGTTSIPHGSNRKFSFTPQNGYHVSNVKVDGQSLGAKDSHTFSNVTANHSISVSFSSTTHTISATSGNGGAITPTGAITVSLGADQLFNAIPDSGYVVKDILVDGSSIGSPSSYLFKGVNANHSIEARFELGNQAPRAEAGASQSVEGNSKVSLNGSASSDPEGSRLRYRWKQTNTPTVTITNSYRSVATFTAPELPNQNLTLTFELKVTDPEGLSSTDTCLVHVSQAPSVDTDGDGTPDKDDADDDNDGMPDTWELEYGLNPLGKDDAGLDPDNDGYTNLEEYQAGSNPLEAAGNQQPDTPLITKPINGAERVALSPWFMASEFIDSDTDDTHSRTQWRIVDTTNQQVIWDVTTEDRRLTKIRVQRLVLSPSTTYNATVRYFDHHGLPSEWSSAVSFTTDIDKKDINLNKIPDTQEVPNETDLNYDAIADNNQQNVIMSVTTFNGDRLMAASSENDPNDNKVVRVESLDPNMLEESHADGGETPYGLLAYKVKVEQPGDSAVVSIYLSNPLLSPNETKWVSYDSANGWQDCTKDTEVSAEGNMAQRRIRDGGPGDSDGTVNGTIVELMGPLSAAPAEQQPQPDSGSSLSISDGNGTSSGESGAGCFLDSLF